MEELQQRRRRPITYGRPTRKRLSSFDLVFSSPPSSVSSTPAPPPPARPPPPPVQGQKPKPPPPSTNPNKQAAASRKLVNTEKQPPKKTAPVDPISRNHSLDTSTDEETAAASAQLRAEAELSKSSRLRVFDIPSSEEDSPASAPRKRKEHPSHPPKPRPPPAPPSRKTAPKTQASTEPILTEEDVMPTNKRARSSRNPSKAVGALPGSGKLTTNAKITKAASVKHGPPQKRNEKPALQSPPLRQSSNKVAVDQSRVRVTRSQSRQPSIPLEDSDLLMGQPEDKKDPQPVQRKISKLADKHQLKPGSATSLPYISDEDEAQTSKLPDKKSKQTDVKKPSKVLQSKNIPIRSVHKGVELKVQESKTHKAPAPIKPVTISDFDFFGDSVLLVKSPSRKRLIDSLGVGPTYPNKRSCSPSSGEDSDKSNIFDQQSSSQDNIRNSQTMANSQQPNLLVIDNSQDIMTMPIPKPLLTNGRAGPRVTYARERSFRAEENVDEFDFLNIPLIAPQSNGSRRRLTLNKGTDSGEEESAGGMMKSIHELRAAGGNNRFMDDVEEVFGDIEGNTPLGRKRSGYLEIASKVRNKSFGMKFRANAFDDRLLSGLDTQSDQIICFAVSHIIMSFLLEDSTPRTLLQLRTSGALPMLVRMLEYEKDISVIAKDRKSNMSKAAQAQVADLRDLVEKSPLFVGSAMKRMSPQVLSLKIIEMAVRRFREAGILGDVLPAEGVPKLVGIAKPFLNLTSKPSSEKGDTLELVVSTIESYTIGGSSSVELQFSKDDLATLAKLLPTVYAWDSTDLEPMLLLLLRLSINITNNRPEICDLFSDSSLLAIIVALIEKKFADLAGILEEEQRLLSLDLLILSLGLMINFAELSEDARSAVDTKDVSSGTVGLDILLRIFLERLERAAEADSMEESQSNVAFGYLSILLGNLCQDAHVRYKVRSKLPKCSLLPLLGAIEEFISHNRKVDEQGMDEEDAGVVQGAQSAFTARLEEVIKRLREAEGLS